LPKVFLSGFQKVGDRLKVYLTIPAKDPKDTVYLSLQQGEKGNDVEIVKVNEDKGAVDIMNTGTPETLTLASNGVASTGGGGGGGPAGGGPPSPGGIRNRMMPGMPRANMQAAAPPSSAPTTMGGSAIVIGGNSDGASSGSAYGGGSSSYSGGVTVSGGTSSFGGGVGVGAAPGNNTSAQIANALFSGQQSGYVPPTRDVIPAPLTQQAAGLLINEASGGPPSPIDENGNPKTGGPPSPGAGR
jgi:hypothetical protein